MAMKIKGITIELSADTSGIEKALKGINKSLSDTTKDLQAVDKALKLDPTNVELVEQKQRLLGKAIEDTTNKLKAMKEAQDKLSDRDSDSGQRQYDALTREISATELKLKNLNQEQRNFSAEAADAQFRSTGFGAALDAVATGADQVARKTAAMSAGATAALVGIGAMVTKAASWADEMLTMSQQTGLSTDSLQKMNYAAQQIDVPMETIVGSVNTMKKHLNDTSGIWDRLGVSVRDQSGQYRDIESIFYDTIDALGGIENETERDTMAMQVFGRSASEMAGMIDDGGAKLRELGNTASSIGAIIPEDDLEKLGEFDDRLEELKSKLTALAAQAAVPLAEALLPGLEALAEMFSGLASVVSNMNPHFIQIGVIFLGIIAVISPFARMIANITDGFLGLVQITPYVKAGILAIQEAFTSFASNPYTLMILAICAALALLAAAIYLVVDNWDVIGPAASDAFDTMKSGIESANEKIMEFAQNTVKSISNAFGKAADAIGDFIGSAMEVSGISNAIDNIGEAFAGIGDAIGTAISDVLTVFEKIKNQAAEAGSDIIDAFVAGVKSVIDNVAAAFEQLGKSIQSVWDSIKGNAKTAGTQTAQAYANGVASGPTAKFQSPVISPGSGPTSYGPSGNNNYTTNSLYSAIESLNTNLVRMGSAQPTNVNVELVGSAKNIFETVRVQNSKLQTATGYHALA